MVSFPQRSPSSHRVDLELETWERSINAELKRTQIEGLLYTSSTASPLPRAIDVDSRILNVGPVAQVYPNILELEATALEAKNDHHTIYARVLGYLILVAPKNTVRQTVAAELARYRGNLEMYAERGKTYCDCLLHVFKRAHGSRPVTAEDSPLGSFARIQQEVKPKLEGCPTNHQAAKETALYRDGLRCVATATYDVRAEELPGRLQADTQCAHIIPSSLNAGLDKEDGTKKEYASVFWATLAMFGYAHLQNELKGGNIHSLTNVLTLSEVPHTAFDKLALWFEATHRPNVYRVHVAKRYEVYLRAIGLKEEVEFTSPDPEKYPLPSPAALEIHAMCARVSWLSGAGEYIDRIQRDVESTSVLAEDGSSATLLRSALEVYSHQPLKMEGFQQPEPLVY